ncbi:ATP-grasp domain-containing protein OS=Lysinibacillus sphaericus OX=1421 GN=LS41612_11480 PE=4 SV=1 [Lysinibacillus sphaericus]
MKSLFEMANIPYTPYCHPYSLEEIVDFQNEHKKIVLKPISGAGSVGVEIFENSEEILKYFKNHGNVMDLINGSYILEKFINGNVFHVDVLSYKNNHY